MITKKVAKGIEKLSESCVESWFEAGLVGPGPDADECHAKLKERILQAIEGLMDRRSLVVQALDNWASQNVGAPAPSPALMSPKFRAHILETLGVEVTHVIVVPGHGEVYALGADAAREAAVQLLCPDALNS